MGSEESQMYWAEMTGYQASSVAALNSDNMKALWEKDSRFKTTYDQVPYAVVEDQTRLIPFNEVRTIFNNAWDSTILKNENAKNNLANAQVEANRIINQYQ